MPAPARILVIRGGAMGDFILTLPVLGALRRRFPAARLELLANAPYAPLAIATSLADDYRKLDAAEWASAFTLDTTLPPALHDWLSTFDLILSYLHDPNHIFKANICQATPARWIQCPTPALTAQHAADQLLVPLAPLDIRIPAKLPELTIPNPDPSTSTLALHPGSGSPTKNWPETHWTNLLDQLITETDLPLLLIGGEAEQDTLPRLAARLPAQRHRVLFHPPLPDLARALVGCAAFLGHDSGPTHLAAALRLPTVALWGQTPPEVWKPLGPAVHLLRPSGGLNTLTPAQVLRALTPLLPHPTHP